LIRRTIHVISRRRDIIVGGFDGGYPPKKYVYETHLKKVVASFEREKTSILAEEDVEY